MIAASPSDWADYLLVADWQPVRDRVLVEATNVRHTAHAGLLLLLSTPTEVTR